MFYMQEYSTCTNHNSIAKVINTHTPVEKSIAKLNKYNFRHALFFFTLRYG